MTLSLGDKLFLAPLEKDKIQVTSHRSRLTEWQYGTDPNAQKVLDIGTGTGGWSKCLHIRGSSTDSFE